MYCEIKIPDNEYNENLLAEIGLKEKVIKLLRDDGDDVCVCYLKLDFEQWLDFMQQVNRVILTGDKSHLPDE